MNLLHLLENNMQVELFGKIHASTYVCEFFFTLILLLGLPLAQGGCLCRFPGGYSFANCTNSPSSQWTNKHAVISDCWWVFCWSVVFWAMNSELTACRTTTQRVCRQLTDIIYCDPAIKNKIIKQRLCVCLWFKQSGVEASQWWISVESAHCFYNDPTLLCFDEV